jgi:hypothetical protein
MGPHIPHPPPYLHHRLAALNNLLLFLFLFLLFRLFLVLRAFATIVALLLFYIRHFPFRSTTASSTFPIFRFFSALVSTRPSLLPHLLSLAHVCVPPQSSKHMSSLIRNTRVLQHRCHKRPLRHVEPKRIGPCKHHAQELGLGRQLLKPKHEYCTCILPLLFLLSPLLSLLALTLPRLELLSLFLLVACCSHTGDLTKEG